MLPRLIEALQDPQCYEHPVTEPIKIIETQVSWVLLTGEYVYKIKKELNFGFLDFSTLAKRQYYCEEELRLNQRLAPDIYQAVVIICGSINAPKIREIDHKQNTPLQSIDTFEGTTDAFEYAVRMRQFDPDAGLDLLLAQNKFEIKWIDQLAEKLSDFHQKLPTVASNSPWGEAANIWQLVSDNYKHTLDFCTKERDLEQLTKLYAQATKEFLALEQTFLERRKLGFIRECHGDLHLGNINVILVFLMTLSLKFLLESKHIKFGLVMAIVIMTKPFFIVFVLPLLLHKKYKEILSLAGAGTGYVLISLIVIGLPSSIDMYFDWFAAMLDHNTYLFSNNTIFFIINRYTGVLIGKEYSFLLLGIIAVVSTIYFWLLIRKTKGNNNGALMAHIFMLIAVIPSVFITDTEHFILSLPLIAIIVQYFSIKKRFLWIPLFAFIIFLYGGNSTDMMGDELNEYYKRMGMLGIGNLTIIATVIFLYTKNRKAWDGEEA